VDGIFALPLVMMVAIGMCYAQYGERRIWAKMIGGRSGRAQRE